jgi:hypothetical protein
MGHGPCWCSRHVHKMSMYCAGNYVISVASLLAANDRSKAWAISSERWDLGEKTGSSSEFYFISLFIILSCLAHRLIAAHPISLGPTLQTHYCKTVNTSVKHRCWRNSCRHFMSMAHTSGPWHHCRKFNICRVVELLPSVFSFSTHQKVFCWVSYKKHSAN